MRIGDCPKRHFSERPEITTKSPEVGLVKLFHTGPMVPHFSPKSVGRQTFDDTITKAYCPRNSVHSSKMLIKSLHLEAEWTLIAVKKFFSWTIIPTQRFMTFSSAGIPILMIHCIIHVRQTAKDFVKKISWNVSMRSNHVRKIVKKMWILLHAECG